MKQIIDNEELKDLIVNKIVMEELKNREENKEPVPYLEVEKDIDNEEKINPEDLQGAELIAYYEDEGIDYDLSDFSQQEIFDYAIYNLMFDEPSWIMENFEKEEFLQFLYEHKDGLNAPGFKTCASYAYVYCHDRDSLEDLELIYSVAFNESDTVSTDDLEEFIRLLKERTTFNEEIYEEFLKRFY